MIKKIKQIIVMFEKSKLSEMDVEFEDIKLSLKKPTQEEIAKQVVVNQVSPPEEQSETIVKMIDDAWVTSPLVGIFYGAPTPSSDPFVQVNQTVKKGDVLCVIEAMKVMNEIKSTQDGVILEIAVDNQQMVEFNQNLFRIGDHD